MWHETKRTTRMTNCGFVVIIQSYQNGAGVETEFTLEELQKEVTAIASVAFLTKDDLAEFEGRLTAGPLKTILRGIYIEKP